MIPEQDNDLYNVAVKVFLRDGDKLLVLKSPYDNGDLPGGRIGKTEFDKPLEEVADRELHEELGNDLKYKLGNPVVFMRTERKEQILPGKPKKRIFAIGYEAEYLGGAIRLSHEHQSYDWVDVKTFKPESYFEGGWLKGVQEYLEKVRARTT